MSALPPEAGITESDCYVRFVPKADITLCPGALLVAEPLNHVVPGNRMKLRCVHVVICHQKTSEPTVVRIKHDLRGVRTSAGMK